MLGALCVALVLSMHLDTAMYRWQHGPNPGALVRQLAEVELYSLRPIDLFMPMAHRIEALAAFAQNYRARVILNGENGTTYLGAVGCASLLWLLRALVVSLLRGGNSSPVGLSLQALWIIVYSVCGSLNMVPAVAGFYLFRAMNRVSIILLPIALFYFVRELSRISTRWPQWTITPAAALIVAFGLWDQTPVYSRQDLDYYNARLTGDQAFAKALEKRLPKGSMIFQLPITRFPDSEPVYQMPGYEHLRPYIFSKTMHFSHGDDSGRATEAWRQAVAAMPVPRSVTQLEKHGFGGIIIDRDGYRDHAAGLIQQFENAGRPVEWQQKPGPFVLVPLQPAAEPQRPRLPPLFTTGWYAPESAGSDSWRWSTQRSAVEFYQPTPDTSRSRIAFGVESVNARTVRISHRGKLVRELTLAEGSARTDVVIDIDWTTAGDKYLLDFQTDQPPPALSNGDGRRITFRLLNLVDDPPAFPE